MTTIYIDTSVAINEAFLRSSYARAFLRACNILHYTVVVPEIVVDELKGNYPKKIAGKISAFQKATRELEKLVDLEAPEVSLSGATDEYDNWLDDFFEEHGVERAPYPSITTKEIVQQSYEKKKPFKASGEGHKDYIVWKTILHGISGQTGTPPNIFLTNNTKDFCGDPTEGEYTLHPDLAEQITSSAFRPTVYQSIKAAFESELAPQLEGITLDDIPDLSSDVVEKLVDEILLDELVERSIYGLEGLPLSNDITISSVGLQSINSVNLKRVENQVIVNVIGEAEVEVDGFMDKSEYYMSDENGADVYVVDGNWNDHVMLVSSAANTPFDLTFFYSLDNSTVTGKQVTLPLEIQDEWPYK